MKQSLKQLPNWEDDGDDDDDHHHRHHDNNNNNHNNSSISSHSPPPAPSCYHNYNNQNLFLLERHVSRCFKKQKVTAAICSQDTIDMQFLYLVTMRPSDLRPLHSATWTWSTRSAWSTPVMVKNGGPLFWNPPKSKNGVWPRKSSKCWWIFPWNRGFGFDGFVQSRGFQGFKHQTQTFSSYSIPSKFEIPQDMLA